MEIAMETDIVCVLRNRPPRICPSWRSRTGGTSDTLARSRPIGAQIGTHAHAHLDVESPFLHNPFAPQGAWRYKIGEAAIPEYVTATPSSDKT
eukprot:7904726-Pyramimonas_sp.AAC.1